MVAIKRIVTGTLSLVCGVGLLVAMALHGSPPPVGGVGLIIFFGGGVWTLRDGLRLRRELGGSLVR
jgi:hypothetical protein